MRQNTATDRKKIYALAYNGELFAAVDAAVTALKQFDEPSVELRHLTVCCSKNQDSQPTDWSNLLLYRPATLPYPLQPMYWLLCEKKIVSA